jgi:hypothetical protein
MMHGDVQHQRQQQQQQHLHYKNDVHHVTSQTNFDKPPEFVPNIM